MEERHEIYQNHYEFYLKIYTLCIRYKIAYLGQID